MRRDNEVIIFQKKRTLPNTLPESLHSKGFRNRIITELRDLGHSYDDASSPILLVDGGPEVNDTTKIVETLLSVDDIWNLPVVIVSRSAETFEKTLGERFCVAIGVRVPCTTTDIIAALTYIDDHYQDFIGSLPALESEEEVPEISGEPGLTEPAHVPDLVTGFEKRQIEAKGQPVIYDAPSSKEADRHFTRIFNNLSELGLMSRSLGGQLFATAMDEAAFPDKTYFTITDERARELTDQIAECTSQWDRGHVHRTAYLAWEISRSLGRPDVFVESTKQSCLLYLSALLGLPQEFLRRDYFHPRYQDFREDFARRAKEIAFRIGVELELPLAGKIVGKLSNLIGGESADGDDEIVLAAAVIQGADLVGRACAKRGYFEPELAYDFLRRIRRGVYSTLHPLVLSCLVKVLAEAVVMTALGLTVPKKKRNNQQLQQAARDYAEQKIEKHEVRVAIQALTPGMKLSRPIESFDGKEVLAQDLVLDQDLIWRIWQLSAIRPLNAPLVVTPKK